MMDLKRAIFELPVAVLDFETTGLPENGGRACEVAAIRYEDGLPVARFSSLVNPGCKIPPEAVAVHGIRDADVAGAPTLPELAGGLLRICEGAVPCAYQAPFDRHMLHQEVTGLDCLAFDPAQSWIDVLVLVRHFDRWERGKGRHKLANACKRHGIELSGAHRAEADAIATGALLWAFKKRLGDVTAEQLIKRCDERRAEQDAEFRAWLAKQPPREGAAE